MIATGNLPLCQCGCGERVTKPTNRFIKNHGGYPCPPNGWYIEEDCGHGTCCWVWQGTLTPEGYGHKTTGGIREGAHRWMFKKTKGPIPDGLHIDHLCRNPSCVNPEHLEPVTCQINTLRGVSIVAKNAAKTHCKRGHPLFGDNLYIGPKQGNRHCRQCRAIANRRIAERQKGTAACLPWPF